MLIVLEIALLFGHYIRFVITVSLGNVLQSCFAIIIRLRFMVMFFLFRDLKSYICRLGKFVVNRIVVVNSPHTFSIGLVIN